MQFTPENAKEMAQRSVTARTGCKMVPTSEWTFLKSIWKQIEPPMKDNPNPVSPVAPAVDLPPRVQAKAQEMVLSLEEQIKRYDQLIREETNAKAISNLATAKDKAQEKWLRMVGIPKEATPKLVQTTSKRSKPANLSPID